MPDRHYKPRNQRTAFKAILTVLAAFLFPAMIFLMVEFITRGSATYVEIKESLKWMIQNPFTTFVNYCAYFAICNIFQLIKRKGLYLGTQAVCFAFFLIYAIVGNMKITYRMEPILLSDTALLRDAWAIGKDYFPMMPWLLAAAAVALALGFVALVIKFPARTRSPLRWGSFILSTALFVCIALYFAQDTAPYATLKRSWKNEMSMVNESRTNGVAWAFAKIARQSLRQSNPPEGYSKERIQAICEAIEQRQPAATVDGKLPNIIFILGESAIDPTAFTELAFARDPVPNLRQVMDRASSGLIKVSGFGGGTSTSEQQVLQGFTLPGGGRHAAYGIPASSRALGYHATALHAHFGWFYDRYQGMQAMGFDEFIPLGAYESKPKSFGYYARDEQLYDIALDVMRESSQQDMLYIATMQTHGGYGGTPKNGAPFLQAPMDESVNAQLEYYLYLLNDADRALGDFLNELALFSQPTAVVYFGDHLPAVSGLYSHIGLTAAQERAYLTPYFIWTNYEMPVTHRQLMAPELGAYALNKLGIPMTPFERLKVMLLDNPEDASLANDLLMLTYDCEYGKQYYYQLYGYTLGNPEYLIGRRIAVNSARIGQVNGDAVLMLEGQHFTWNAAIRAAGNQYALTALDGSHVYLHLTDKLAQTLQTSSATFEAIDNRGFVIQSSAPFTIGVQEGPVDSYWSTHIQ